MKLNLTKNELHILYHLINDLNTIGEIGTYLNPRPESKKGDYLWNMEKLEWKLADAAFDLKSK